MKEQIEQLLQKVQDSNFLNETNKMQILSGLHGECDRFVNGLSKKGDLFQLIIAINEKIDICEMVDNAINLDHLGRSKKKS